MSRFSLINVFLPVSHGQFVGYCAEFKAAAEKSFGTSCAIKITGYKALKSYITIIDDELQANCDDINKANEIFKVSNVQDVSAAMWRKARYVDVFIAPENKEHVPRYAFASIEFKGKFGNAATFYMQPGDDSVRQSMRKKHLFKLEGDGFADHGEGNAFMGGRPGLWAMSW